MDNLSDVCACCCQASAECAKIGGNCMEAGWFVAGMVVGGIVAFVAIAVCQAA
jgi:hypothetical protein